ncbi:hypothetical protein QCA50_019540 [Cerrena zonata]|uniref:DOMON domain-containing protein n=1 Tax=Cerrena zonata TaxID=2478898 RepID=A0AAW0FDR9_9APHY
MRSIFKSLLVFGLVSLSLARPQDNILQGRAGHDDGDDHDSNDDSHTSTSSAAASTATGSVTSANTALVGMQGDSVCTGLMCIGGFVNGTSVTYTLQSQSSSSVGWMAMGFGSQMANTPMVIMWPNSDGKITLSQRKSTGEFMPTVDSSPPRTATAQAALSTASGSNPKLVFTIPQDSTVGKSIIWAYGNTNPGSDAVDATLVQHLNSGPTSLNLANTLAASDRDPTDPAVSTLAGGTTSDSGSGSGSSGSVVIPLLNYQKMLIAHGVLCTIGFLLLLPAGALLARYLRSFSNAWFKGHWIIKLLSVCHHLYFSRGVNSF